MREREVGRLDALEPVLGAHEQATGRIDPLENTLAFARAILDRDPFAKAKGAIEPSSANSFERLATAPSGKRLVEPLGKTLEQLAATHRLSARARETGGCAIKAPRRMRAINADPNHAGGRPTREANAFSEDPGAFRASRHQIVRPFEADVGGAQIRYGARQRHAGDEAELRRKRRRTGIDHEGAGVEVASR